MSNKRTNEQIQNEAAEEERTVPDDIQNKGTEIKTDTIERDRNLRNNKSANEGAATSAQRDPRTSTTTDTEEQSQEDKDKDAEKKKLEGRNSDGTLLSKNPPTGALTHAAVTNFDVPDPVEVDFEKNDGLTEMTGRSPRPNSSASNVSNVAEDVVGEILHNNAVRQERLNNPDSAPKKEKTDDEKKRDLPVSPGTEQI